MQKGGKPKGACKSYRPVALPCIFKIFLRKKYSHSQHILHHADFQHSKQEDSQKNIGW